MGAKREMEEWKERMIKRIQEEGAGVGLTHEEYQKILQLPEEEQAKALMKKILESEKRKIN